MSTALPEYAPRLDALHVALAPEFDAIVGQVALSGSERALDAGCGDGFFTGLLAARIGSGQVIGLDSSPAFLDAARQRLPDELAVGRVRLVQGDVNGLPLDDGSLDVVWSAHSMQSYDDIPAVLTEFRRVLRPGGRLAVLESDALHSILLPWPARLELAVRQAELRLLGDQDERRGAYFPRYAARLLGEAGFGDVAMQPTLIFRPQPFSDELAVYVRMYCKDLLDRTRGRLAADAVRTLKRFAEAPPESPGKRGFPPYFASLQMLITGRSGCISG